MKEPDVQAQFADYYYDSTKEPKTDPQSKPDDLKKDTGNIISTADVHISSI